MEQGKIKQLNILEFRRKGEVKIERVMPETREEMHQLVGSLKHSWDYFVMWHQQ